ncbi:MAG: hypothetical protein P8Y92_08965 [Halioglobus sp.]
MFNWIGLPDVSGKRQCSSEISSMFWPIFGYWKSNPVIVRSIDFQEWLRYLWLLILCDRRNSPVERHNGVGLGKIDFLGAVPGMEMTGKIAKMTGGKPNKRARGKT